MLNNSLNFNLSKMFTRKMSSDNPHRLSQTSYDRRRAYRQARMRLEMRRRERRKKLALAVICTLFVVIGCAYAFATTPPQNSEIEADKPETPKESTSAPQLDERGRKMKLDSSDNSNWRLKTDGEQKIYLTFDDGPSEATEKILQILQENDVKATFFVTGHSPECFHLIKKEWDSGHSVGMHSYSHNYSEIYTSVDAYKADLAKIGDVIKEQIGFVPYLFRFPGGSSNSISAKTRGGIMTELTDQLVREGFQYYDWNITSGDAGSDDVPVSEIVDNSCQEGWTNIMLLMHDTDAKKTTVEALPQIIKFYKDRGYKFCAIDRDSFAVHHAVNN